MIRLSDRIAVLALETPTLPPATTTNTEVVVGSERVAIIEPATPRPQEQARLDAAIDAVMEGRGAVVLITHHHGDHHAYARALADRLGAPLMAHRETQARVSFTVDATIEADEVIPLGDRTLCARFTPGHAPGHLAFLCPEEQVVYAGDLVAGEGTILVDPSDDGDMAVYLDSLRGLADELRGESWRLVPSHGPVIDEPVKLLEYYVRHRLEREAKLLAVLDRHGGSVELSTLTSETYDDLPVAFHALAKLSVLGHLGKLENEGRTRRDGPLVASC